MATYACSYKELTRKGWFAQWTGVSQHEWHNRSRCGQHFCASSNKVVIVAGSSHIQQCPVTCHEGI